MCRVKALTCAAILAFLALPPARPAAAADQGGPVIGDWLVCMKSECFSMTVGSETVEQDGKRFCSDVIIEKVSESLSIVNCVDRGGAVRIHFLLKSEKEAVLWFAAAARRAQNRLLTAKRPSESSLHEKYQGAWKAEEWGSTSKKRQPQDVRINASGISFTDGRRKEECRVQPLSEGPGGGIEFYLDCGRRRGHSVVASLQAVSKSEMIMTMSSRKDFVVLYREGKRPDWLPDADGKVKSDICRSIEKPAKREECYASRGICEKVSDPAKKEECRQAALTLSAKAGIGEVKSNLGAIRSVEVAYFAEWSMWVGNQPLTPVPDRKGNSEMVPWEDETRFSILGFRPEKGVRCSYSLEGSDHPSRDEGFTARAECDLDGDGEVSIWKIGSKSTSVTHSGDDY